ncbi:MAG TPA: hypothetical protein VJ032_08245 [Thermoanaerobaculia bacterium]|nr:hypothetical protein [Thermoanaerobaculia bacterium]
MTNFGNPATWFDWLRDRTVGLVEVIGTLLAAVVLIWCWKDPPIRFVPRNAFALLAALPGFMAFAYHCISSLPRFHARREATRDYDLFVDGFDAWWTSEGWQKKLTNAGYPTTIGAHDFSVSARNDTDDDFLSFRPMLSGAIWGALLLSLVFLIAVGVADDHRFLMGIEPKEPGLQGFLFAALGAYVSVMWRMINRIHANALSYRFVFTATLRAAVAMAVGYVAARVNLFTLVKDSVSVAGLYFLIGLFTDWALASLRARARTVFNQPDAACDRLPLCLIDGLDDGMIDILDELGIWDIEHLATSEPAELTIRTLYPFNRVIDWIDQAILIMYIRRKIGIARELGVTGAIDLAVLYSYTLEPNRAPFKRADATLEEMSKKMSLSRNVLDGIAETLYFDYTVEQLYRFWQHHRRSEVVR